MIRLAREWGAAVGWMVVLWGVLFLATLPGCARLQTPEGTILIAPPALAERFASDVERVTGMRPGAFALPWECVPPVYLDRATAENRCARVHEATHVEQRAREGHETITRNYWGEFERCWRGAGWRVEAFDGCYRGVSYEREAYAAQVACEGKGGSQP